MSAFVLVLEDDEELRELLVDSLGDHGYCAHGAAHAKAALELARRRKFDVMVTDVCMAGLDGLQALEQVQVLQPAMRSIVITGFADDQAPLRAIRLRASDYLYKPFSIGGLLTSVKRTLEEDKQRPFYQAALDRVLTPLKRMAVEVGSAIATAELASVESARMEAFQGFYVSVRSRNLLLESALFIWNKLEWLEWKRETLKNAGWHGKSRQELLQSYRYVVELNASLRIDRHFDFCSSENDGAPQARRAEFQVLFANIVSGRASQALLPVGPYLRTVSASVLHQSAELRAMRAVLWDPAPPE